MLKRMLFPDKSAAERCAAGHVFDRTGCKVLLLSGCWNSHVDCTPCGPDGEPTNPGAQPRRLWTCNAKPEVRYSLASFRLPLVTV